MRGGIMPPKAGSMWQQTPPQLYKHQAVLPKAAVCVLPPPPAAVATSERSRPEEGGEEDQNYIFYFNNKNPAMSYLNRSQNYNPTLTTSAVSDLRLSKPIPSKKPAPYAPQHPSADPAYLKAYASLNPPRREEPSFLRTVADSPAVFEQTSSRKKLDGFLRNTSYFSVSNSEVANCQTRRLDKSEILEGEKRGVVGRGSYEGTGSGERENSYNKIMEKLDKKEKLINELKKLSEFRVSDKIRNSYEMEKEARGTPKPVDRDDPKPPAAYTSYSSGLALSSVTNGNFVKEDLSRSTAENTKYKAEISLSYLKEKAESKVMREKKEDGVSGNKNPEEPKDSFKKIKNSYYTPKEAKPEYEYKIETRWTPKLQMQKLSSNVERAEKTDRSDRNELKEFSAESALYNSCNYSYQQLPLEPYSATLARGKQSKNIKQIKDIREIAKTKGIRSNTNYFSARKPSILDFQLGKALGQGKFGTVYQCAHKQTQSVYAVKKIRKEMIAKNLMAEQLLQEIKIQLYCNHENILKLYGVFDDADHIYLVLEYMEEGTLFQLLKRRKTLSEGEAAVYLRQVAQAITYLHDRGIAHRDIKPENIVMSYGVGKLCDFGWAAICTDRRKTYCGTFDYAAPEILEGSEYDMSVDLWCLGVLAYELLVGRAPFYHISRKETMKKILNVEKTALEFPPALSRHAVSFVENLVRRNPEERMEGLDLLRHPFLALSDEPN